MSIFSSHNILRGLKLQLVAVATYRALSLNSPDLKQYWCHNFNFSEYIVWKQPIWKCCRPIILLKILDVTCNYVCVLLVHDCSKETHRQIKWNFFNSWDMVSIDSKYFFPKGLVSIYRFCVEGKKKKEANLTKLDWHNFLEASCVFSSNIETSSLIFEVAHL